MALNTKIRGVQIIDGGISVTQLANDAVETLKIKDKNVTLAKLEDGASAQIIVGNGSGVPTYVAVSGDITIANDGATTIGATKVVDSMVNDDVATGLAGVGLSASSGVMALDVSEVTGAVVDVSADSIVIQDATDDTTKKETIADLATAMAGSGITATDGVLSADANAETVLVEDDIKFEDYSGDVDGFELVSAPLANSVQIFLNGLLQQEGSGKDYTLTGSTVAWTVAPDAGDLILAHYIAT